MIDLHTQLTLIKIPTTRVFMSVAEQGDGWSVEVTDDVVVWESLDGRGHESFCENALSVLEWIVTTQKRSV